MFSSQQHADEKINCDVRNTDLYKTAKQLNQQQCFDESIEKLQKFRNEEKDSSADIQYLWGINCNAIADYNSGLEHLENALTLCDPQDQDLRSSIEFDMGVCHRLYGNFSSALKFFMQSFTHTSVKTTQHDLMTMTLLEIGLCHVSQKQYENALPFLSKAIVESKEDAQQKAFACLSLGEALCMLDKFDEASICLNSAYDYFKKSEVGESKAVTAKLLSYCHLKKRNWMDAFTYAKETSTYYYEQGKDLSEKSCADLVLGLCYYMQNELLNAQKCLQDVLKYIGALDGNEELEIACKIVTWVFADTAVSGFDPIDKLLKIRDKYKQLDFAPELKKLPSDNFAEKKPDQPTFFRSISNKSISSSSLSSPRTAYTPGLSFPPR